MAFVTLKDVAQRAGVSAAAVSQILHNKGRFSSDTRQLVLKTVEEMGYVPDQRARSMRSSDTKTVGLLVPDLRNPYFADLVSSMEDELYAQGYSTLIGTSAETVERQDAFIDNLLGQRIDGAIVVPQGVNSPGMQSLIARELPLVFVDRLVSGLNSVPFVVSDPYPGVCEAVAELVRLGHRHIGFVSHSSLGSSNINEREAAFRSAVAQVTQLGEGTAAVVDCDSTYVSREAGLNELVRAGVTAIICAYSPDMITMIGLLHDRGIDIGSEMSVISFDDIAVFRLLTPQVAIISQQAEDMGRQGVDMLLDMIINNDCSRGESRYVPSSFVLRDSVGAPMWRVP